MDFLNAIKRKALGEEAKKKAEASARPLRQLTALVKAIENQDNWSYNVKDEQYTFVAPQTVLDPYKNELPGIILNNTGKNMISIAECGCDCDPRRCICVPEYIVKVKD